MSDLFSQIKDQLPPDTYDLSTAEGRAAWDRNLRDFINSVDDLHVRQHLGNMVKEWRWTVYNPEKGGSGTREITSFYREDAAYIEALKAENARLRPWAELGHMCMQGWPEIGDIEGFDLHDWAVKCGVLREIPGGYEPECHVDSVGVALDRGDPWFEIVAFPRAALQDKGGD